MARTVLYVILIVIPLYGILGQVDRSSISFTDPSEPVEHTARVYPLSFTKSDTIIDTVLQKHPFQYDPARRAAFIGNLNPGYLGGEILNTVFSGKTEVGFEIGHDAYDAYKMDLDTVPFFKRSTPYTHLLYAQGSDQTRTQTEADFGAQFNDQLLSIGYRRIFNRGEFQEQKATHTSLYVGYNVQKDKWALTLLFGSNVIQDTYNAGITTDTLFGTGLSSIPVNIPIRSNSIETRHQERQYLAKFDYHLPILPLFKRIRIQSQIKDGYIKVYDTQPDSAIYSDDFIRPIGLRQYIQRTDWGNKVSLLTKSNNPFQLEAGIKFHSISLYQEPVSNQFAAYYLFGILNWQLSRQVHISGDANYGFQQDQVEYSLNGRLDWTTQFFRLSGWYRNASTVPDLVNRRMILLEQEIYNTDFTRTIHNQIGGSIALPDLGLSFTADLQSLFNYRYWTAESINPLLADFTILQLKARHQLNWGPIRMNNHLLYQSRDETILPLPDWQGMHQLYFNGFILKNTLDISLGGELRYYLNYNPAQFQPFIGSFTIAEENPFEGYPYTLDFISKVRIDNFHFLFRLENIQNFWEDTQFYSHHRTPFPRLGFRLGVQWRLKG